MEHSTLWPGNTIPLDAITSRVPKLSCPFGGTQVTVVQYSQFY